MRHEIQVRARVVSLSPLATRFVVRLGAADRLVGVDAESAQLPGLRDLPLELPVVGLETSANLAPDLVLVEQADGPRSDRKGMETLSALDAQVIEFQPHDFEDVWKIYRLVGQPLIGEASALSLEVEHSRPLALIGGETHGRRRPRVLAVVGVAPLEIAGGHSFETDLIELAGATSITHGGDDFRLPATTQSLAALAPELILVMTPHAITQRERSTLLPRLAPIAPVEFIELDTRLFWLNDSVSAARRVQRVIAASLP